MKNKVLIFGGTTEGRELADLLSKASISHAVSVATEYGGEIETQSGEDNLFVGRRNAAEIAELITAEDINIIVDATHPFATGASAEIKKACDKAGREYIRLSRNTDYSSKYGDHVVTVKSTMDAARQLSKLGRVILILTGSKNLKEIVDELPTDKEIYARVLPNEESIGKCKEAGLSGKHIIAMQGPFSKQLNVALIREVCADVILTKESGKSGGFDEKIEAAAECGIKAVVMENPEKEDEKSAGKSLEEVFKYISKENDGINNDAPHKITVAGMGPGGSGFFTADFERAAKKADIIFGAPTVLSLFKELTGNSIRTESIYRGDEIVKYLAENNEIANPLVIYSGDISLCSGATKAVKCFENSGYKVFAIPGISSVTLFAKKLQIDLERCKILSVHGKEANVTGYALKNEKLIVLAQGREQAKAIISKLPDNLQFVLGCELGGRNEKIITVNPSKEHDLEIPDGRILIYIENPYVKNNPVYKCISDDEFIRGKVPMTKEEIRSFSIRKLGLTPSSVLYDIGAGTGSISVEAALIHPDIKVYSIEKNEEALEIITSNRNKFYAENISIVAGNAPEALEGLPVPTHVFIGGSSGNMEEIIKCVRELNKDVRIVINCLTPETLSDVVSVIKKMTDSSPDITQIMSTRFKKTGNYNLPCAQNPVYIIAL
ncbi:precorrin-6A reductase [Butyrivibrio sp. JL13D10]|uniref:precorrin-6A reductase n=1 Tax=Butyrivibrio sp. JL13D10 TaxID=3236815 RepID=UPI0038B4FB1C